MNPPDAGTSLPSEHESANVTHEQVKMMKVKAMKDFCRARCLPVSGNKEVLTSRVYCAIEMNIPVQLSGAKYLEICEQQYQCIVSRLGISTDPVEIPDILFKNEENGMALWPDFAMSDLTEWLVRRGQLQKSTLDKARGFYTSGWCKEVFVTVEKDILIMKNRCTRSQALSSLPHECWVAMEKDSANVVAAYCSCVAGMSEACNHVTALLLRVEDAVSKGLNVGTAHLGEWRRPSAKTVVDTSVTVEDVIVERRRKQRGKEYASSRPMFSSRRHSFHPITPAKTSAEHRSRREQYARALSTTEPTSSLAVFREAELRYNPTASTSGVRRGSHTASAPPAPTRPSLPPPATMKELARQYVSASQSPSPHDFLENYLPALMENEKGYCDRVEAMTRGQSSSPDWFRQRQFRITASKVHPVSRRQKRLDAGIEVDNTKLVKGVTSLGRPKNPSEQPTTLRWGIEHEEDALAAYKVFIAPLHVNMKVESCGLFVSSERPFLGASPDALLECDCCGRGVLEIKCPYTLRNKNLAQHPPKYLNEDFSLKKNHSFGYFDQVTANLGITGRAFCHLYMWSAIRTPDDYSELEEDEQRGFPLLTVVNFDAAHWEEVKERLSRFYLNTVARVLVLGERIEPPLRTPKKVKKLLSSADNHPETEADEDVEDEICPICFEICVEEPDSYESKSIECDSCARWLHFPCGNIARKGRLPKFFQCPTCKA